MEKLRLRSNQRIERTSLAYQRDEFTKIGPDTGGDILVNGIYTFEIGGKSKQYKQIQGLPNSFIIADEWDYKIGNKIPIWLLGLLY